MSSYSWQRQLLDPVTAIYLFLLKILHGNTACLHVIQFGGWSFTERAYCQARKQLPLIVYHGLLGKIIATSRAATAGGSRWLGHRGWLVDGSSFSISGERELQLHFGQSGNQRKSCGFPEAKWLALFDLTAIPLGTGTVTKPRDVAGSGDLTTIWNPATLSWEIAGSVLMLIWLCSSVVSSIRRSASIRGRSSTLAPAGWGREGGRMTCQDSPVRGRCCRKETPIMSSSGVSRRRGHPG